VLDANFESIYDKQKNDYYDQLAIFIQKVFSKENFKEMDDKKLIWGQELHQIDKNITGIMQFSLEKIKKHQPQAQKNYNVQIKTR
jgi:hypothetical protein